MQDVLHRSLQLMGGQCGHHRPGSGLIFFTPKTTAQPGHINFNLVHRKAYYTCRRAMDSGRTLGGGMDLQSTIFGGVGISALGFNIQLFLSAGLGLSFKNMFTIVPGFIDIT